MAQKTESDIKGKNEPLEQLQRKLDTLDQRLDDIDSMISAIAERAMSRPLSISMSCPGCGKIIEVGIVGSEKMMRNP